MQPDVARRRVPEALATVCNVSPAATISRRHGQIAGQSAPVASHLHRGHGGSRDTAARDEAERRTAARDRRRGRPGRRRGRGHGARERPPGGEGRVRDLRPGGRLGVHRHGPVGVAPRPAEQDRAAARGARLRLAAVDARVLEQRAALHDRAHRRRALGLVLPAPRDDVPQRRDRHPARPRDRDRRLLHLPARLRPGPAVRRPAGPRLPGVPDQPAADPARTRTWRRSCSRSDRCSTARCS